MITTKQYQRLMKTYQKSGEIAASAMKADIHPQTASKYIQAAKPPEELQRKHDWRTRPDPLEGIWEQAQTMLSDAPELEAKELFNHLQRQHGQEIKASALRSFQRRVQQWRLQHGTDKEVFFEQKHIPGRLLQMDWTHAGSLGVSIEGRPLDHLLCHVVLTFSNWAWATRCQSESMLSLRQGLQAALGHLGKVPERLQIDNSSSATHRVGSGGRAFNPEFLGLVEHYGLKPQTIQVGRPNENGDVESRNGHLKRQLEQHLILRGYRDFAGLAAYDEFLAGTLREGNKSRQARVAEELAVMRPLPLTRLSEYDEVRCLVSHHSTIRVKKVTYSVPARLIGQEVKVEVYEGNLKIYHGRELLLTLARALGDRGSVIDYRHVIDHLLRKPGAFTHYVHRAELFPDSSFRLAYDRLVEHHGLRAGELEYLRLLKLAAELGGVATLAGLVAEVSGPAQPKWRVSDLRQYLDLEPRQDLPLMQLEPELGSYDALLEEVAHVG